MKLSKVIAMAFSTVMTLTVATPAFASLTTTTVTFGSASAMGCGGKGICSAGISGINVNFTMIDQNTLEMSFSMTDLQNSQPNKVQDFQGSSYMFDANFYLSSQVFSGLGLAPVAMISTTSASNVYIRNGIVYDDIAIAYGK